MVTLNTNVQFNRPIGSVFAPMFVTEDGLRSYLQDKGLNHACLKMTQVGSQLRIDIYDDWEMFAAVISYWY